MEEYRNLQESPAARSPQYMKLIPEWNYLWDIFEGVSAWSELDKGIITPTDKAEQYLPRHPEETGSEYVHRFRMSEYPDSFAAGLQEYVDLMFSDGVALESAGRFEREWESLSDMGLSGDVFLPDIALKAMIFGVYHLFIDYVGDRPRWIPISPRDIVNWSGMLDETGKYVLSHVGIETKSYRKTSAGYEEVTEFTRYEYGGAWRRWQYFQDGDRFKFIDVGTGVLEAKSRPLAEIPLVPVHLSPHRPEYLIGYRRFRRLADKTKVLYQVLSDYRRKMQLCNTPIPVLFDPSQTEDLVLSPNRLIRLTSPDSYFRWSETSTDSLDNSRIEIDDLKQAIANESASFLTQQKSRVNTGATQLSVAPLQSSLYGFSTIFSDAINKAIAIHQNYMGDKSPAKIQIIPSVSSQNKDSQFAFSVGTLNQQGIISRHSAVKMLQDGGYIPDDVAELELEKPDSYSTDERPTEFPG